MPKRTARKQPSDQESEQVEDVMAWGSSRQNYYKDSENQYSSLEEEQQEAQRIYERQLQQLQDEQLYEIPQKTEQHDKADEELQQPELSRQYLTKEIKKTVKLGLRLCEQPQSTTKDLLQSYLQSYLMSLIAMREIKIPYIQYHPLVNKALQLKEDISKLKHLLDSSTSYQQSPQFDNSQKELEIKQENAEGIEADQYQENNSQIQRGLSIYQKAKAKIQSIKKQKKQLKRAQRATNKRPAFLQVKGNEGRLASQTILKNKGLIKKRKKIDRNSRVKLRRKFDKANSKRRAYGHLVRQDPGREYEGERNIKLGRIASVKIK